MRVVLCCIAKNEELYINDFVNYYLKIGFDTIYIYDNNEKDKPLKVNNDRAKVFNSRGIKKAGFQKEIYTMFYNKYKDTFDWCLFVDIDEFLINVPNIKVLLSLPMYKRYNQMRFIWKLYGDDNLITRDMAKPVYKVFKKVVNSSLARNLQNKGCLERQAKCIVRGHLNNVVFNSVHYASYKNGCLVESCLPNGKPTNSRVDIKEKFNDVSIFLNHYMTKSLSEFVNQKLNRNDAVFNKDITLDYYWRINEKTKEKIEYLTSIGVLKD